jgi:hypothetical protein
LSIAWVGVVFVALGKDHFKGLWQPHASIEVEYKGEIKDVLDSSRPPDELRRRIVDLVKRGAAKLQSTDPVEAKKQIDAANTTTDELLKVMTDENARRSDQLQTGLAVLLIPPIALLLIGTVLGWVISGFRSEPI